MSEESKVEAVAEDTAAAAPEVEAAPKKKKKKWPIVVGVVVVVLVAAGAGFWVWHEQPSFCNAICHTPMDPYLETWNNEPGTTGVDKYGNEVSNTDAMLVVTHKKSTEEGGAGTDCLGCHVPTLSEQIQEGMNWMSGNYEAVQLENGTYVLPERSGADLVEARGLEADQFCLNEACHHVDDNGTPINTREDLKAATADLPRNVHIGQHGPVACTECHKAHRASVVYCTQCHSDVEIPDGWLTYQEGNDLPGVE